MRPHLAFERRQDLSELRVQRCILHVVPCRHRGAEVAERRDNALGIGLDDQTQALVRVLLLFGVTNLLQLLTPGKLSGRRSVEWRGVAWVG